MAHEAESHRCAQPLLRRRGSRGRPLQGINAATRRRTIRPVRRVRETSAGHQSKPAILDDPKNAERLVGLLSRGFRALFERDADLFELGTDGVNEQTITFRLGLYLHGLFEGYQVDCEYNRLWDKTKACQRAEKRSMRPDVIIHRRRSDISNLFCLEAKKDYLWDNAESGYTDIEKKLVGLTHPEDRYRYILGAAWRIMPTPVLARHACFWFINGAKVLETSLCGFEAELIETLKRTRG